MKYTVLIDGQPATTTDWPIMAEAAWHRVTRLRDAATVELWKDGVLLKRVTPQHHGAPWPEESTSDLRDVLKALLQLLRDDKWDAKEIADAMTDFGLPTSRARIDSLKGGDKTRRAEVSAAEMVVLINAVLTKYKKNTNG